METAQESQRFIKQTIFQETVFCDELGLESTLKRRC